MRNVRRFTASATMPAGPQGRSPHRLGRGARRHEHPCPSGRRDACGGCLVPSGLRTGPAGRSAGRRSMARGAAEPHGPVGWRMATLGSALPALMPLVSGVRACHLDVVLLRRPVPILRAMVVFDERGDTCIRRVDSMRARSFLLHCWAGQLDAGSGNRAVAAFRISLPPGEKVRARTRQRSTAASRSDGVWRFVVGAPVFLVIASSGRRPAVLRSGLLRLPWSSVRPRGNQPGPAYSRVQEWIQELPAVGRGVGR